MSQPHSAASPKGVCLHTDTVHEPNGDIICRHCGMVLENIPRFRGTGTKPQGELRHHEITRAPPTIGTEKERTSNRLRHLAKIDKQTRGHIDRVNKELYYESRHLLSALSLPHNLLDDVIEQAMHFYSLMERRSRLRNSAVLAAASIYFTCLDRTIFVQFTALKHLLGDRATYLKQCIQELYLKVPEFTKFNRSDFRKQLILRQIEGLYELMTQQNKDFVQNARNWVDDNWKYIDAQRNRLIAGLAYIINRNPLPDKLAADFLGIQQCNLSYAKGRLQRIQREIQENTPPRKQTPPVGPVHCERNYLREKVSRLEHKIRRLKGKTLYLTQKLEAEKGKTRQLVERYRRKT